MSQPPTKKAKVTSASTVDQGPPKSPLRQSKRLQLATRPTPRADDVDGDPMSEEAKAERIQALKLYLKHKKAIEDAGGIKGLKTALRNVEDVLYTSDAAARGRSPSHVRENFLRLKFSGLLQTCIDYALKVIEERHPNDWVAVNYADGILTEEILKGAKEVSKENLRRCKEFAKAYMPDDEFDDIDDSMYQRLKWYIGAFRNKENYLKRFTIETLKIEIQEKLDRLDYHTELSPREAARELWTFLKENWKKDPEDDHEYFMEGHPLFYEPGHPLRDAWDNDH